jgi:hypothetical protein
MHLPPQTFEANQCFVCSFSALSDRQNRSSHTPRSLLMSQHTMEEPAGALDTMEKLVLSYTPVASGQSCTKQGSNRTAPASTKDDTVGVPAINIGGCCGSEDDHMRAASIASTTWATVGSAIAGGGGSLSNAGSSGGRNESKVSAGSSMVC